MPVPNSACASPPEVGAQSGSSARWDLCGGRPERARPYRDRCSKTQSPYFHSSPRDGFKLNDSAVAGVRVVVVTLVWRGPNPRHPVRKVVAVFLVQQTVEENDCRIEHRYDASLVKKQEEGCLECRWGRR